MKTITIKSNGLGRYDDVSPFILSDGKLELQFTLPVCNGQFFFIAENNEAKFKKFIPDGGKIIIVGLTPGELKAEVKHYIRGEYIESFKIEPLLLRQVNCDLSGTPEITALKSELAGVQASFEEYKKEMNAKLAALFRFAYADYKNNIYLSGGSFEDFLKEYKIELSEEERKEIF